MTDGRKNSGILRAAWSTRTAWILRQLEAIDVQRSPDEEFGEEQLKVKATSSAYSHKRPLKYARLRDRLSR